MATIFNGRYTAKIEQPFVVFLIGMRINKLWRINKNRCKNNFRFLKGRAKKRVESLVKTDLGIWMDHADLKASCLPM